jgi:hypothetical protein
MEIFKDVYFEFGPMLIWLIVFMAQAAIVLAMVHVLFHKKVMRMMKEIQILMERGGNKLG